MIITYGYFNIQRWDKHAPFNSEWNGDSNYILENVMLAMLWSLIKIAVSYSVFMKTLH